MGNRSYVLINCSTQAIKALFPPDSHPFYAGFGNRDTDELSYLKVGIPMGKIFIINPKVRRFETDGPSPPCRQTAVQQASLSALLHWTAGSEGMLAPEWHFFRKSSAYNFLWCRVKLQWIAGLIRPNHTCPCMLLSIGCSRLYHHHRSRFVVFSNSCAGFVHQSKCLDLMVSSLLF